MQFHQQFNRGIPFVEHIFKQIINVVHKFDLRLAFHYLDHEFKVNPLCLQINLDSISNISDEKVLEREVYIPFYSDGMRCVDSGFECNDFPGPLPIYNILIVLTLILFIPLHHLEFIFGFSFFLPLLFLVIIVVNVLYEQIIRQLHERDEVLPINIPPLLV